MDSVLEMLGLNEIASGIGALFALFFLGIILVVLVVFLSAGSGTSYAPRLTQGSGEVIAIDFDCHLHSAANTSNGERELRLRFPCDRAESEAARYPARKFSTRRVEMLRIAYVDARGVAVDGFARRDALDAKGPIDVGQYVAFYFDPYDAKRELTGSPPKKSSSFSWGWMLGIVVFVIIALPLLALIASLVTGFSFLGWIFSAGASD